MKRILNTLSRTRVKAIILVVYLLSSIFLSALLTITHFPLSMDFGSFLASGQAALSKGNPYDHENDLVFTVYSVPSPNLNPPITVLIFKLFAALEMDPINAAMAWKIVSLLWYMAIVYCLIRTHPESSSLITILWVLALVGFWQTVEVGQIYMPLVTIALLAWDSLKKDKPGMAGIFIGLLIAIKPQFAIWVLFLFFANQRTVFINSVLTFVMISMIPLWIFGVEIYVQWAQAIFQYKGILLPGNTSLQSLAAHMGIPGAGNLLSAALVLSMLAYAIAKKFGTMQFSAIALLSTLLASPYSWCGYTLFLLPVFFDQTKWSWKRKIAAGLLTIPFIMTLAAFDTTRINFILFGWTYGWAVVLLLFDELSLANIILFGKEEQRS